MKRHLFFAFAALFFFSAEAAENPVVKLPEVSLESSATLAEALKNRRTVRDFTAISDAEMPQTAANLLWSACGINRKNGKKVIPAALARYAVSVYFADRRAVYRFDARENALHLVASGDILPLCASNRAMCEKASAALLLVIDDGVWGEERGDYAALEAGAMMQNVYLYCASAGLGTVACGSFNGEKLREALSLGQGQRLFLTMPVGRAVR